VFKRVSIFCKRDLYSAKETYKIRWTDTAATLALHVHTYKFVDLDTHFCVTDIRILFFFKIPGGNFFFLKIPGIFKHVDVQTLQAMPALCIRKRVLGALVINLCNTDFRM